MALRRSRFDRLGGSVALQGVECLLAVIQASWVSHGASPQIKMQEHNPAFCHRACHQIVTALQGRLSCC